MRSILCIPCCLPGRLSGCARHTQANCQLYQDDYCAKQADCAIEFDDIKKSQRDASEQPASRTSRLGGSAVAVSAASRRPSTMHRDLDKWTCVQFYDVSSSRRYVPLSCVDVLER